MFNHVPHHHHHEHPYSSSSSYLIREPPSPSPLPLPLPCSSAQHADSSCYFSDHGFEGQNQIPFCKNNRIIEEAFSRVSITPQQNTPDFLGQRSTIFSFDEQGHNINNNYPFLSSVQSMQHQEEEINNNIEMMMMMQKKLAFLNTNQQQQHCNTTVPMPYHREFHSNSNGVRIPQRWFQRSLSRVFDLRGKILHLAKTQCGCRVLQNIMEGLTSKEEVSVFFKELVVDDDNVVELMGNCFGNYVFQKLVEICSEEQITAIVFYATKNAIKFVNLCLDIHGTRSVQKLLEHVTKQEQRSFVMSALTPSVVTLSTHMNGLHVVDHCVKHFSGEDTEYMLKIVAANILKIATDKSGCCVIQQLVDHSEGESKDQLLAGIIVNAPLLAQHCYGNYVVQHLVSLKIARVTKSLMKHLEGKFVSMSCNKYGSNVVEKFFRDSGDRHSRTIILEILRFPNLPMLLVDPYANFVISSAVIVSQGGTQEELLKVIKQHSLMMRRNHYGKKLLGRLRKFLCHV
ncbi:hypothetical protein PIB30_016285 [Stylosanthes scabra]|uniref:PUM-HD domain-containing protein n=1 Tax=Stylosanthes scabra TaxID=79078 RepID=A0ABU6Z4W3_9FABA|nr:hypothetical protein [Stylosanthes scabra]